jgi:hypothetical protein
MLILLVARPTECPECGEAPLRVASMPSDFLLPLRQESGGVDPGGRPVPLFPYMHIPLTVAAYRVQTIHRPMAGYSADRNSVSRFFSSPFYTYKTTSPCQSGHT